MTPLIHLVTNVRMAIVFNGLGLCPLENMEKLVPVCRALCNFFPKEGEEVNWRLYIVDPTKTDPLLKVTAESWLVDAVCAAMDDPSYPFGNIDPAKWCTGLGRFMREHKPLFNDDEIAVADELEKIATNDDNLGRLEAVRAAIKERSPPSKPKVGTRPPPSR